MQFETHDGATLRLPAERADALPGGAPVRIGVRPEKLAILPADVAPPDGMNVIRGRVELASFLGVSIQYQVHTAGGEEITAVEQNLTGGEPASVGPGREVLLAWDPHHTFVVAKERVNA